MRYRSVAAAASLALMTLGAGAAAQGIAQKTIKATADAWVDARSPSVPHGGDRSLVARFVEDSGSRILLKFSLQDLPRGDLQSAKLVLTLKSGTGAADGPLLVVQGITGPWSESATWENQPELTRTYAAEQIKPEPGPVSFDVTRLLRDAVDKKFRFQGIAIAGPTAGIPYTYSLTFASTEQRGSEPKLIIDYLAAEGTQPKDEGGGASNAAPIAIAVATVVTLGAGLGFARWRARSRGKESATD